MVGSTTEYSRLTVKQNLRFGLVRAARDQRKAAETGETGETEDGRSEEGRWGVGTAAFQICIYGLFELGYGDESTHV